MAKELGNKAAEGEAYGNLGVAHDRLGEFITAIRYHECCLRMAKELGVRSAEGLEYGYLGNN